MEKNKKRSYLDYAASAPVDTRVGKVMRKAEKTFANPNSLHSFGMEARKILESARADIASALGLRPDDAFGEIIFTGSATEANNLALRGVLSSAAKKTRIPAKPKIIISKVEHDSVYETAKDIKREGLADVAFIPVNKNGVVDVPRLAKELDSRTVLVSVMYVNNEVGTVEPVKEISKIISDFRKTQTDKLFPVFHTDAVQAFQYFDCNVGSLCVDLLTLSAHKLCGPKGVGALFARGGGLADNERPIKSVTTGGEQEFGLRGGTQNVQGIAGFAEAVRIASASRAKEFARVLRIRRLMIKEIKKLCPRAEVNGDKSGKFSSPHVLNVWFPGITSDFLLMKLDIESVAASSGSACRAHAPTPPRTVTEMFGIERAKESVRFSMGKYTTHEDVKILVKVLKRTIGRA